MSIDRNATLSDEAIFSELKGNIGTARYTDLIKKDTMYTVSVLIRLGIIT